MEIFDCLFDYLQAEKDIEAVKKKKKKKKKDTKFFKLKGPIDNDIDKIKTEDSI